MRIPIPTPHTLPFTFLHITLSLELFSGTLACSGDGPHNHYDRSHVEGFARSMERPTLPNPDDKLSQLEWGELNLLHTTDIHGWYAGHTKASPPEPNYSGDWGAYASFTSHMREQAEARGADLLLVDTGDLHDGNGLSDGFPREGEYAVDGHVSNKVFGMVDYDVLTIGNHELYNFSVAKDVHEHFAPRWNGRYLTSNVNITLPDTFSPTGLRSRPIGSLLAKFETPVLGLRVTALGVIFNFRSAAPGLTVQDPATMVEEKWFADAIDEAPDVFLIAGHIPVRGDPGFAAVHAAIRKRHPTVPIAMLGGHSHVRDCVQLDPLSMSLESGRYLETIGWMSISGLHGEQDVRFARKYIDANRRNYAFHANLSTPDFDTRHGKHISWTMRAIADEWNLTRLHGIAPQDYYLERVPYGHNSSLLTLLSDSVLPTVVRGSDPSRRDTPSLVLINSGSQRFDVYAGDFTTNDQYIVSPFIDRFLHIQDVPWRHASKLLSRLNAEAEAVLAAADDARAAAEKEARSVLEDAQRYDRGLINHIFDAWLRAQWAFFARHQTKTTSNGSVALDAASRPEHGAADEQQEEDRDALARERERLPGAPSLGYVTIDDCPGKGDDTEHSPIPFSPFQPEYVSSDPSPIPGPDDRVDVVFVDFILKNVVRLLNGFEAAEATEAAEADENAEVVWDSKIASTAASKYSEEGHAHGRSADRLAQIVPRTYSIQEARPYGDITTQLLYPRYAEIAWRHKAQDQSLSAGAEYVDTAVGASAGVGAGLDVEEDKKLFRLQDQDQE